MRACEVDVNIFGIGGMELVVIGLVAFLLLGPRKMAEAGKTVAKILSEVRRQRDELTAAIMQEPDEKNAEAPAGPPPKQTDPRAWTEKTEPADGGSVQERAVPQTPVERNPRGES
ncbi:MAG: twin-arginine translocase TatA/TatE family subunit [Chloroflexi bacterium]|nr:twin-arginine translocase TatA/TatE family subunit [Chloroflexota bacterium]